MLKIKNVVTAYKAQANPQIPGGVDVLGAFDNLVQPMFPFVLPNLSIILTVEDIERPTMFEIRVNAPDDGLISSGEFGILPDPFGVGKKILDLNEFIIADRGQYTIDVFEKVAEDKVKFIATEVLFIADYPPQRRMSDEEKAHILATEGVIKTVRTELQVTQEGEPVKIQVNLDKNAPVDEGFLTIPEDGSLTIGDQTLDLTGIRRQIEWMFGNPIPEAQPEGQEGAVEEPKEEAAE